MTQNTLTASIDAVINKHKETIAKATKDKAFLDAQLKQLREHQIAAEEALNHAVETEYQDKLDVATKIRDAEFKAIKKPTKFDPDRVKVLRNILATHKDKTLEDRLDILKALYELQLYVVTFPIAKRVGEILMKWTGKDYLDRTKRKPVGKYPTDYILTDKNYTLLSTRIYADRSPACMGWGNHRMTESYEIDLGLSDGGYAGVFRNLTDFWEIKCAEISLDVKFLINPPKKPAGEFAFFNEDGYDYAGHLAKIRSMATKDCDYSLIPTKPEYCYYSKADQGKSHELAIASAILGYNPERFKFKSILKAKPELIRSGLGHIEFYIEQCVKRLARSKLPGLTSFKIDMDNGQFIWNTEPTGEPMFDPDTCEMRQPSEDKTLSILDATPHNLPQYIANRVEYFGKYGYINALVDISTYHRIGADRFKTIDQDLIDPKYREYVKISQFKGDVTSHYVDSNRDERDKHKRFAWTLAIVKPLPEHLSGYKFNEDRPLDEHHLSPVFDHGKLRYISFDYYKEP